jgi:hypothetical protein
MTVSTKRAAIVMATLISPAAAAAADSGVSEWLPWIVLGAIVAFVAGVALRMLIAARFPKGYGVWARSRRDSFAERNARWDRADDEFRK